MTLSYQRLSEVDAAPEPTVRDLQEAFSKLKLFAYTPKQVLSRRFSAEEMRRIRYYLRRAAEVLEVEP